MPPEAAEATETSEVTGSEQPAQNTQPADFGDEQIAVLKEKLGLDEPRSEEPESIPDDSSFYDLLGAEPEEEPEEPQYAVPPQQYEPVSEDDDDLVAELEDLIGQAVEERLSPHLESIKRQQNEQALQAFAKEHPDMKTPAMIDAIGQKLGAIADAHGNPALRADPKLVALAYMAVKAEAQASTETPAEPGSPAAVETGGTSAPDTGPSAEEQIKSAIVNAGGKNPGLW